MFDIKSQVVSGVKYSFKVELGQTQCRKPEPKEDPTKAAELDEKCGEVKEGEKLVSHLLPSNIFYTILCFIGFFF